MNQKTSNQIERIIKKLILAKDIDKEFKVFGAEYHQYIIGETVSIDDILKFENDYNLVLPECYKTFLLHIGNGGISNLHPAAGPSYGIFPLGKKVKLFSFSNSENYLKQSCKNYPGMSDESWKKLVKYIDENDNISDESFDTELGEIFAGILPIGSKGCTFCYGLVLNGKFKGRVVNIDLECQKPFFAFESNFLDWYERWLDEITSESTLEKTDLFNLDRNLILFGLSSAEIKKVDIDKYKPFKTNEKKWFQFWK